MGDGDVEDVADAEEAPGGVEMQAWRKPATFSVNTKANPRELEHRDHSSKKVAPWRLGHA